MGMVSASRFRAWVPLARVAAVCALLLGTHAAPASSAAAEPVRSPTVIGAASASWSAFDAAVGPVGIYRDFDSGFGYPTWQDTPAYRAHPNAAANEYSFKVSPQRLANPNDPIVAKVRSFVATTPLNIILTNYHEPERNGPNVYTPAQYRTGLLALHQIVQQQNAVDGGTRKVSLILMNITFKGKRTTSPSDWWPTQARDGGQVDIVSADVYALPHATGTPCCPTGYTDGINWQQPAYIMKFVRDFAAARNIPWSVSELGYLEDVNNPQRRATALRAAIDYARANGAHHVSYFDSGGPRASWHLRWTAPKGTASSTSSAFTTWRTIAAENRP